MTKIILSSTLVNDCLEFYSIFYINHHGAYCRSIQQFYAESGGVIFFVVVYDGIGLVSMLTWQKCNNVVIDGERPIRKDTWG